MSKNAALYLMMGGLAVTLYDTFSRSGNPLYGPGRPLEMLRWRIPLGSDEKIAPVTVSISDLAVLVGAWFYFGKR